MKIVIGLTSKLFSCKWGFTTCFFLFNQFLQLVDFCPDPVNVLWSYSNFLKQRQIDALNTAWRTGKVAQGLHLTRVLYHSDCQILVTNINAQDPIQQAADWRIRPSLAHFIDCNTHIQYKMCVMVSELAS